jgi:hypothetical protein
MMMHVQAAFQVLAAVSAFSVRLHLFVQHQHTRLSVNTGRAARFVCVDGYAIQDVTTCLIIVALAIQGESLAFCDMIYTQSTQKVLGTTVTIFGPMYDTVGDNYDDDDDDDVHTDSQSRLGVGRGPGRAEEPYATRIPRSGWHFLKKYTGMMLRVLILAAEYLRATSSPDPSRWVRGKGSFDCRALESSHFWYL